MASSSFRLPLAIALLLAIICGLWASPTSCHADDFTATMTNEHEKEQQLMMMMDRFHRWMATHNRSYASADEKLRRFEVYRSNMEFIEATNRNGSLTFKLGETPFTDLTHDEFLASYTGGVRLPSERRRMQDASDEEEEEDAVITTSAGYVAGAGTRTAAVPESVDWRKEGAVTPAKYQGQCAACWAFSAVAAIESLHKINGGDLISLSEQELVDCKESKITTCSTGYPDDAFLWVSKNKGIASDLIYPYVGERGSCKKELLGVHNATVRGVITLPENREDLIMAAVAKQPVAVLFDASDPLFQNYRGNGVYKGGTGCNSSKVNHALTIVGYGTNHPADTGGGNYWIAKNSYGSLWGDNGFIYLAKDTRDRKGVCGLAIWPTFPTIW